MNKVEQLYFKYLINSVCSKEEKSTYSMLLMRLFETEFVSYDEFDDNLVENSLGMRDEFYKFSETGRKMALIYGEIDFNCTVLELMVYLSIKIEDTIMSNNDFGDRTGLWFWSMIDSLGLKNFDNFGYDEEKIDHILTNFIEKKYQKSGKGGLFTVKNPSKNERIENIWSQAMNFLVEFACENGEIF